MSRDSRTYHNRILLGTAGGAVLGGLLGAVVSGSEFFWGFIAGVQVGATLGFLGSFLYNEKKKREERPHTSPSTQVSPPNQSETISEITLDEVQSVSPAIERSVKVGNYAAKAAFGCSAGMVGAVIGFALGGYIGIETYSTVFTGSMEPNDSNGVAIVMLGLFELVAFLAYSLFMAILAAVIGFFGAGAITTFLMEYKRKRDGNFD